jgi:hypothetical protein
LPPPLLFCGMSRNQKNGRLCCVVASLGRGNIVDQFEVHASVE